MEHLQKTSIFNAIVGGSSIWTVPGKQAATIIFGKLTSVLFVCYLREWVKHYGGKIQVQKVVSRYFGLWTPALLPGRLFAQT